jgi:hypothetical protein
MAALAGAFCLFTLTAGGARAAETLTVDALIAGLEREIAAVDPTPPVRADFARIARDHALPTDAAALRNYLRVKTVFEATREAGWWRLAWTITDRQPQSDAIWAAWRSVGDAVPRITASAECDETSALVSLILRRLGVKSVGLFWPQSNHTVAVWKAHARDGTEVRIVLPTSQVFLEPDDGFDTRAFDPKRQRTIYDYTRADVKGSDTIPAVLGEFFLAQVRRYAAASDRTQRKLRVLRARFMSGEASRSLEAERQALAVRLRTEKVQEDLPAVEAFGDEIAGR